MQEAVCSKQQYLKQLRARRKGTKGRPDDRTTDNMTTMQKAASIRQSAAGRYQLSKKAVLSPQHSVSNKHQLTPIRKSLEDVIVIEPQMVLQSCLCPLLAGFYGIGARH